MDTDGRIDLDWPLYRQMLSDGTYVVIDDYFSPGNQEKGLHTKKAVDKLEENGELECFGIYGWGTWVGRLK